MKMKRRKRREKKMESKVNFLKHYYQRRSSAFEFPFDHNIPFKNFRVFLFLIKEKNIVILAKTILDVNFIGQRAPIFKLN